MLVADTSALVSLAVAESHGDLLAEFEVHTSDGVVAELASTADYDDVHGVAAAAVLEHEGELTVHDVDHSAFDSSRVGEGEGSCVSLCRTLDPDFLVTDDLRAVPELRALVETRVAISPIVLRALEKRGRIESGEARRRLDRIAEARDWLGAPIYRRAVGLFDDPDR